MKDFWKFSFHFSCLKEYLPFMPIKPIMFLTVNILKKLPRINVYALDQVQLGIIPKNDMKFNFTVQMFERRTGKGDFKILQQIWQSAFRWNTTENHHCQRFHRKVISQTNHSSLEVDFKLLSSVIFALKWFIHYFYLLIFKLFRDRSFSIKDIIS